MAKRPARRRTLTFTNEGGRLLSTKLERRGMTLAQAEQALELAQGGGLVSRLIRGDRKPGRELGVKLKDVFGIPLDAWDRAINARSNAA